MSRIRSGDREADERLMSLVYSELRRMAGVFMRRERPDHTLQPTALVHEAWMRMAGSEALEIQSRAHFFATAARMMRRILIDHARASKAERRGGSAPVISLDNALEAAVQQPEYILDVHLAMDRLQQIDPERAQLAELRYFGGLSIDEIAEVTGMAARTVDRQWRVARAWLSRELSGNSPEARAVGE